MNVEHAAGPMKVQARVVSNSIPDFKAKILIYPIVDKSSHTQVWTGQQAADHREKSAVRPWLQLMPFCQRPANGAWNMLGLFSHVFPSKHANRRGQGG
jgi:hypothetical protein